MATREIKVPSVASADGTRIGCEVAGAGPPLLLVHGSTADRSRWASVREALAARFTLHLMTGAGGT
jgi:pimeloyl-ACP methyl ester carboxylesterase